MNGFSILQMLLRSDTGVDDEVRELAGRHVAEDLWLDYKRGAELRKAKGARNADLRRWVSGFANAAGGVLLIGIAGGEGDEDAERWSVTGCDASDVGGSLSEWASRVLGPLAPYLSPPPVIREIAHPNGAILAIAVDRAPNLVPVVEQGAVAHYLRIGDQSLRVDPYLHADLVLGRRRSPELTLRGEVVASSNWASRRPTMDLSLTYENEGLVWVPRLQIIVVGYVDKNRQKGHPQFIPVSNAIRRQLDIRPMGPSLGQEVELQMLVDEVMPEAGLPPMQWGRWRHAVAFGPKPDAASWLGAVCLLPSNGLPHWCQLSVALERTPAARLIDTGDAICTRLPPGTRPRVAYGGMDEIAEWDG